MKTIITILFLCSVAVGQQAAAPQSSQQLKYARQQLRRMVTQAWHHDCVNGSLGFWRDKSGNLWAELRCISADGKHIKFDNYPERPKASAQPEPSGKPDSEKPEKK